MPNRTLNLVGISGQAWAVFAVDVPDVRGDHFFLKPVVALALVECRYADDEREQEIRPVCVVEGAFEILDPWGADQWIHRVIDAMPDTLDEHQRLNAAARDHLEWLRRREAKRATKQPEPSR